MTLVRQPENSNLCGQACVATLMNVSLDYSIMLIGKKGKTTIKDLVKPLTMAYTLLWVKLKIVGKQPLPELCIVRVRWTEKQSHWVLKDSNQIHDPAIGTYSIDIYSKWLEDIGAKFTSYFPLQPKPEFKP
jgi:hypothetical protein